MIKTIEKYYQIPLDFASKDWTGFPSIDEIVVNKIEGFASGNISDEFRVLTEKINSSFDNFLILNRFYSQFPSYSISIELYNKTDNRITNIVWLNIKVSLLTNHFTVFFENNNWFHNISVLKGVEKPVFFSILSSQNKDVDAEGQLFEKLIAIGLEILPNYTFVEHKFLFENEIEKGVPYRMNLFVRSNINSFYHYLFDNDCWLPVKTVVQ